MNAYIWDTVDDQFELGEKLVWRGDKSLGIKELFSAYLTAKRRTIKHIRMVEGVIERTASYCERQVPPIPPQRFGVRAAHGLLNELEARDLSDNTRLLLLFTFVTPNGVVAPTIQQIVPAMRVPKSTAQSRMRRLAAFKWNGRSAVTEILRESGMHAYTVSPSIAAVRHVKDPAAALAEQTYRQPDATR